MSQVLIVIGIVFALAIGLWGVHAKRGEVVTALVLPALTLFLLPIGAIVFARVGGSQLDSMILSSVDQEIAKDPSLDQDARAQVSAFYHAHPPSSVCGDDDPRLENYRKAVCEGFTDTVQFFWVERLAWGAFGLGLLAFALIGVLGLVAVRNRRAQYAAFVLGWRSLVFITAVETVIQGALAVWLSYWITALILHQYWPKLILVAAVMALVGVGAVLKALVSKAPKRPPIEAEPIFEADAPLLWKRVKELATRLGTTPPSSIVAGIDDNFFVAEGLTLSNGQELEGRVLYVSLPLLRVLSPSEADAVFGHELAHFRGGDTEASAKLSPALVGYRAYQVSLAEGGLTLPASFVMELFRVIFELALKKDQRQRELLADAAAVSLTSPDDLARSLMKVSGYSSFRNHAERELFTQREVHAEQLGIRDRIDAGLQAHVAAPGFVEALKTSHIPHPFDSHPPLEERLANVKASVHFDDAVTLFDVRPQSTWVDEMTTGEATERKLWGAYEARFRAVHEQSLAWRYLPSTDAERALVLRFFPELTFESTKGRVRLTFDALTFADGDVLALREVSAASVESGDFTNKLVLTTSGPTVTVDLKQFKARAAEFRDAFGLYWQRNQAARKSQSPS